MNFEIAKDRYEIKLNLEKLITFRRFVVCLSFYKSEVDCLESAPRPYVCSYMSMGPGAVLRHGRHGSCHAFFRHGRVSRIRVWKKKKISKEKEAN